MITIKKPLNFIILLWNASNTRRTPLYHKMSYKSYVFPYKTLLSTFKRCLPIQDHFQSERIQFIFTDITIDFLHCTVLECIPGDAPLFREIRSFSQERIRRLHHSRYSNQFVGWQFTKYLSLIRRKILGPAFSNSIFQYYMYSVTSSKTW